MTDVVIAGILNCTTGEITDTVTDKKSKTALRLKVRDELNKVHGKDAYYAFELDTALGFNMGYIRKLMKTSDKDVLKALELLNYKYSIHMQGMTVKRIKEKLEVASTAMEQCCDLFDEGSAELEFVQVGLGNEIEELNESLDQAEYYLKRLTVAAKKVS